jgi:hypothetical protein
MVHHAPANGKEKPVYSPYYAAFRTFVKQLSLPWHHYQLDNLMLLAAAFLKRPSLPVRRLARTLGGPGSKHLSFDKRLRRFLGNKRLDEAAQNAALGCLLRFVLPRLGAVPYVPVMFDWLFVDGHAILGLQIPYRGRALPLCFAVHPKTLTADEPDQTGAEQQLLRRLIACWPNDAPPFLLLCDRGFAKGPLISWLKSRHLLFIIRIPRSHHLYDWRGGLMTDGDDPQVDGEPGGLLHPPLGKARLLPHIRYTEEHRFPLHLVITAKLDPKTGKRAEWRLVTNLPESQLGHVARLYSQRMSPEEIHRDCKRGYAVAGFALSHLGRMRRDRLQRYLLVVALLSCFLVVLAETEREMREWLCRRHWGLGLLAMGLEVLHAAGRNANRLARQACASVTFQPLWLPGVHS